MRATWAILGLVLGLSLLGAPSAQGHATGGLRGLVTRSPIAPVCMQGVPCSAPARNTTLVFVRSRRSVRTETNRDGRYRVVLAPGSWSVQTARAPRIGSGIKPQNVRVVAGRFRVVNFDIDTVIR